MRELFDAFYNLQMPKNIYKTKKFFFKSLCCSTCMLRHLCDCVCCTLHVRYPHFEGRTCKGMRMFQFTGLRVHQICMQHSRILDAACRLPRIRVFQFTGPRVRTTCRQYSRFLDSACGLPGIHVLQFTGPCVPATCLQYFRFLDTACKLPRIHVLQFSGPCVRITYMR